MKRIIYLLFFIFISASVYSQSEKVKIQRFLEQSSSDGITNAEKLGITDISSPAYWPGVTWDGANIIAINCTGKNLVGELNLS